MGRDMKQKPLRDSEQLEGRKTEAMFTLRTAFRIGTKSFPVGS